MCQSWNQSAILSPHSQKCVRRIFFLPTDVLQQYTGQTYSGDFDRIIYRKPNAIKLSEWKKILKRIDAVIRQVLTNTLKINFLRFRRAAHQRQGVPFSLLIFFRFEAKLIKPFFASFRYFSLQFFRFVSLQFFSTCYLEGSKDDTENGKQTETEKKCWR